MNYFESYNLRRLLVPLISIGYVAVAISVKPETHSEAYPFFNWSLFSNSSAKRSDVVVLLRAIDGRQFNPPRLYYEMPETFGAAKARDASVFKAFQRLARAIKAGDEATVESTRRVIEQTFMREAGEAQYDLAIIRYDPMSRLLTGAIEATEVIASFEKGTP